MSTTYRIGIIGLGNMGTRYFDVLRRSSRWQLAWVCDHNQERLSWARQQAPDVNVTTDADDLFDDPSLDVVGIFTLADVRPRLLGRALNAGKHVIAEKPLAATPDEEWRLLQQIEASDRLVTVNLFNRNAWYHHEIQDFIARGEIGELAIIRISHQTPGLMPTEGHGPEGPPFHDCGMHYVDVARWYAGSEYKCWHAQGVRMWDWPEPWWITAHGCFQNGVVFDISVGFVYGQLAQTMTENCGLEVIGSLGVVRMSHDFRDVTIAYHGVGTTARNVGQYGGKKLDVLCENFARSPDAGRNVGVPLARDSVIASQVAQDMLDSATRDNPPSIGSQEQIHRIIARREELRNRRSKTHPSVVI
ncbi:MAG TPA: Gfo/Idh/MocA family oxidoreductase [Herpetosiphonaceae bacterium]|nr:Gfo/Idh/MocA family oxidoreductase [Herpetosiphonaceae bacterium]